MLIGAGIFLFAHSESVAANLTLIDDGFQSKTDSLWHFKSAAFRDGVLSPGLEVQIPGYSSGSGLLGINPSLSALQFVPRQSTKSHRSCFYGYRDDFRIDSTVASHIHIDLLDPVSNPSSDDSVGGLFLFVKYMDDLGYKGLARST